jgi:non-structural maintenance of chromosomes element 4
MSPADGSTSELAVRQRAGDRTVSGSKRKRTNTNPGEVSSHRRRLAESEESQDDREEAGSEENDDEDDEDDAKKDDFYDPDQPVEERRQVQRGLRSLLKDLSERSEEYLQNDSRGLHETIEKAQSYLKSIKRPGEAASDSRLLVSTTDLSYRKTLRLTHGSLAQGVDVDEFVSKCITYMRQGRGINDDDAPELSSTQRRRRASRGRDDIDGDQDVGDEGDMMNWSHLGRFAAIPHLRRPALSGFMLGPLSVEKKVRKVTKRVAPLRPNSLTETRPEVLSIDDLAKKENDLTAICGKILQQLEKTQEEIQETLEQIIDDDMSDEEKTSIMHKHGLRSTGGVDVMRFVVNPKSFGQTVENLFYVSFLIRDGRVQIEYDEYDLPALGEYCLNISHLPSVGVLFLLTLMYPAPVRRELAEEEPRARSGASKHQAILSMDMETWRDIIDTLGLTEPMIEHRAEASLNGPGARGWYS